ncbi:MAG: ABC transporter ATP-binding protein [Actinomycetota bacterium]
MKLPVLARSWGFMRPYRGLIALAALGIVGSTLITVAGPALLKYAIDEGIEGGDEGAIGRAALAYLGLVLIRPVFERLVVVCSARAGERFLGRLRVAAYEHLQQLSMPFFESERAGVLIARLTSDVQTLTTFTRHVLIEVVGSILLLVLTGVAIVLLSPVLAAVVLVSFPLIIVSAIVYQRRSHPSYLSLRERVADTMTSLQEGLTGVRVVKAYGREQEQFEQYRGRSRAQVRAWRRISLVNISFFSVISFAQALSSAAVMLVGGWLYWRGETTIGTVVAISLYLFSLFDPIGRLGDWLSQFQSGRAALTKLVALLETPVTVLGGDVELPEGGALRAERLTFGYGDEPVLHDVSLTVRQGEQLALVGPTGAGKSTLAKLLTRQYDPTEGVVRLGGVDLRDATLDSLRRQIVFLPQEGHLFSGTLADNVRLALPDANDEQVADALRRIGALARFEALPNGLQTDVRTRGVRLSSGERQLVGLARVALADPTVIVLDEATSSLDPATEALVERALTAVSQGRTVITIAHRLSTAQRADRVAVIEGGRLVELATHDELVAQGERYAALWASWQAGTRAA